MNLDQEPVPVPETAPPNPTALTKLQNTTADFELADELIKFLIKHQSFLLQLGSFCDRSFAHVWPTELASSLCQGTDFGKLFQTC